MTPKDLVPTLIVVFFFMPRDVSSNVPARHWADLRANLILFVFLGFVIQPVTALWAKTYFPEFLLHVQVRLPFESGMGWGIILPLLAISLIGEEMTYRTLIQGRLWT